MSVYYHNDALHKVSGFYDSLNLLLCVSPHCFLPSSPQSFHVPDVEFFPSHFCHFEPKSAASELNVAHAGGQARLMRWMCSFDSAQGVCGGGRVSEAGGSLKRGQAREQLRIFSGWVWRHCIHSATTHLLVAMELLGWTFKCVQRSWADTEICWNHKGNRLRISSATLETCIILISQSGAACFCSLASVTKSSCDFKDC